MQLWPSLATRWKITAVLVWIIGLTVISFLVAKPTKIGKLYPTFVHAGENFQAGQPLYLEILPQHDQYRYSPLAAATFIPWTYLPNVLGGILWRVGQGVLLGLTLCWWSKQAEPKLPWSGLLLLSLPIALGNLHNAQMNVLIVVCCLSALLFFQRNYLFLSALVLTYAISLKIYPLALAGLFCLIEPLRYSWRLLLSLLLAGTIPFLLQSNDYVLDQFRDWWERLGSDDRTAHPLNSSTAYHSFQTLLRLWGLPISLKTYRLLEVIAGGMFALGLIRVRMKKYPRNVQIHFAFFLGIIWMTLFGPATETATYAMLAPVVAHAVLTAWSRERLDRLWLGTILGLMLAVPVTLWFPPPMSGPVRSVSPQAHATLLLLGWYVFRYLKPWQFSQVVPNIQQDI